MTAAPIPYNPPRRAPVKETDADECRVCAGPHDQEIHDATLAVHAWLRDHLALALAPVATPKKYKQPAARTLDQIAGWRLTGEERRRASRKGARGSRREHR